MATNRLARRRRLLAVVGLSAAVALVCAVINSGMVGGFPPKLRLHNLQEAAATERAERRPAGLDAVGRARARDVPRRPGDVHQARRADGPDDHQPAGARPHGRALRTAGRADLGAGPHDRQRPRRARPSPTASSGRPTSRPRTPPTASRCRAGSRSRSSTSTPRRRRSPPPTCLANAAPGRADRIPADARARTRLDHARSPQVLPLGPARGAIANGGATVIVAMLTFVTVFGTMIGALLAARLADRRRRGPRSDEPDEEPLFVPESFSDPLPELVAADPAEGRDSWPHTRRPLPWMIAFFLAVIWLTPFDNIQLKASLPGRAEARPPGAAVRGDRVAAGAGGRRPQGAAAEDDLDPRGARRAAGDRVPQRGHRRPVPQPHARAAAVAEEAAADRLLRDRCS